MLVQLFFAVTFVLTLICAGVFIVVAQVAPSKFSRPESEQTDEP